MTLYLKRIEFNKLLFINDKKNTVKNNILYFQLSLLKMAWRCAFWTFLVWYKRRSTTQKKIRKLAVYS